MNIEGWGGKLSEQDKATAIRDLALYGVTFQRDGKVLRAEDVYRYPPRQPKDGGSAI